MHLCKFGQNPSTGSDAIQVCYLKEWFRCLDLTIFSSVGHFVQLPGTICAILAEAITVYSRV